MRSRCAGDSVESVCSVIVVAAFVLFVLVLVVLVFLVDFVDFVVVVFVVVDFVVVVFSSWSSSSGPDDRRRSWVPLAAAVPVSGGARGAAGRCRRGSGTRHLDDVHDRLSTRASTTPFSSTDAWNS